MHDTDIDKDLRDMINAAMSAAGTPDDVRERVLEREEARVRENLELLDTQTWELLDDQEPGAELVPYEQPELPVPYQPQTQADRHFAAAVQFQFGAMIALWRAAPVSFHSPAVQTEFALNLERLVANLEDQPSTST